MSRMGRQAVKYGSERTVPMPDELASIFQRHEALGHLSNWLFAAGERDSPHQNTVGHQWRQTLRRAGLGSVRLHDLRRF